MRPMSDECALRGSQCICCDFDIRLSSKDPLYLNAKQTDPFNSRILE